MAREYYRPEQYAPRNCPYCGSTNVQFDREYNWFYCGDEGHVISKGFTLDQITTYMPVTKEVQHFIVEDEWGSRHHFVGAPELEEEKRLLKERLELVETSFGKGRITAEVYNERKKEITEELEKIERNLELIKGKRLEFQLGPLTITQAKQYRTRKKITSPKALASYRPTLEELLAPSEEGIMVEDVVVTLNRKYEYYGYCILHGLWERVHRSVNVTRIYPHLELQKFRDLINRKRGRGLTITVKDGVAANLISATCGTKSQITGFLNALSTDYPEFRGVVERTVGEDLSRFLSMGLVYSEAAVLREARYCIYLDKQENLLFSREWWLST